MQKSIFEIIKDLRYKIFGLNNPQPACASSAPRFSSA
jgi:hypothetical protein